MRGKNGISVLGKLFFNATVHWNTLHYWQTTPGLTMGRFGFKQPGYRSVFRKVFNYDVNEISIPTCILHGEYRITNDNLSNDYLICKENLNETHKTIIPSIRKETIEVMPWSAEDLSSDNEEKNIITWQWCNADQEINNPMTLSDKWWKPYLFSDNLVIEHEFSNNNLLCDIDITGIGIRSFQFNNNSMWGLQKVPNTNKCRVIRRIVCTVKQLKDFINNANNINQTIEDIISNIDWESTNAPDGFICCITQTVMVDPVKTCDNHIYDLKAIEKWFINHSTSPLTGLHLDNKTLTPYPELKDQIDIWLNSLSNKLSNVQAETKQHIGSISVDTTLQEVNNEIEGASISIN